MKKKSFILHLLDLMDCNELLVPASSLNYAISGAEGTTMVSLMDKYFYVKESLSEVTKLYEETED